MAATKAQTAKEPTLTALSPAVSPPANLPTSGGKKKKNKKGKGKGIDDSVYVVQHSVDQDDLPPLEPFHDYAQVPRSGMRTGLSPELESVHISTTASLSASTGVRLNASAAAQAELLATATDLYRRMDADPATTMAGEQDDYLGSLPTNIRNFVETAWASVASAQSDEMKQRTMYAIAHQMILSGVGMTNGTGKDSASRYPSSSPFDFDPALLSDPKFNQATFDAWDQARKAARPMANPPPAPGQPPRGPLPPTNVVLMNEFGEDDQGYGEDDYYSEDEVDDNVEEEDEDEMRGQLPRAHVPLSHAEGKKKNKKKKKKGGKTVPVPPSATPQPAPAPAVPVAAPPVARQPYRESVTSPVTNPNPSPMPAVRTPAANPPPSSRAAGKQPMAYTPATAAATTTGAAATAPSQPVRSARAAAKAPAPAHAYPHNHPHHHPSPPSSNASAPLKPRPPNNAVQEPQKTNKIWSTNSTQERERIKEFWLGLGEEERRGLVKVEKEAVLRKMKEQQKHSCTCAVCGRKRNAIEDELEVLYDAYYEELEQYANLQQQYASSGGTLPPPPGPGPFPGSVELDKNGAVVGHGHNVKTHPPHVQRGKNNVITTNGRKKVTESEFDEDDGDNDEYEEEEYDEDEDEEDEDEEDDVDGEDDVDVRTQRARRAPPARARQPPAPNGTKANGRDDIFNFGNSLTVTGPGNILTVADDLLKNDGQKFLEMMEQLAERRMQREEEAAADVEDDSDDDEEDDDEPDDEDDEDDEDDDEDDEEEEVMTEEQKMEEGKKMFSIFAARMFEQRVLQAYREKVAQERQLQLLRELEDEDKLTREKEAKKQKENQKKKDKKRLQKLAKEEERAAKAAEKAAEDAAVKEKQQRLEEEQRKKREEERLKREAVRKAQEEEKQRKEEERRKRIAEEKEREAERERKRKEKEEKAKAERKEREEKERKSREEKEAKLAAEKAEKAKREQQEREERERRLAKEREEKAEKEAKERLALQHQQQRAAAAKPRTPASPRANAVASGSTQRQQSSPAAPKKILNKPPPVVPTPQPSRQQQHRPAALTTQLSAPISPQAHAAQQSSQVSHNNLPPSTPLFSPGGSIPPPAMSPRTPYAPVQVAGFGGYGPVVSMQQMPPPPLAPSALPRTFGGGAPYEPSFGRGLGPTAPIGPPSKIGLANPLASPTIGNVSQGSSIVRRGSVATEHGPISRPIAPIARPSGEASGSGSRSGATSPTRRSPSPKGVLGSSALAADDDEVLEAPTRRVPPGPVGQGWQSPRSSVIGAPWGSTAPGPAPGFSSSRPLSGSNLWGSVAPTNPEWHSHPSSNFFGGQFVNHNPSPPPHSGN